MWTIIAAMNLTSKRVPAFHFAMLHLSRRCPIEQLSPGDLEPFLGAPHIRLPIGAADATVSHETFILQQRALAILQLPRWITLQGTNISHLGTRENRRLKSTFGSLYVSSQVD